MYIISDILCNNIISSYTRPSMDLAEPWQIGFQDPATPVLEGIIDFHNDLSGNYVHTAAATQTAHAVNTVSPDTPLSQLRTRPSRPIR